MGLVPPQEGGKPKHPRQFYRGFNFVMKLYTKLKGILRIRNYCGPQ